MEPRLKTDLVVYSGLLEIPKTQRSSTNKLSVSMSECRLKLIICDPDLECRFSYRMPFCFRKCRFRVRNLRFGCGNSVRFLEFTV